MWLRSHVLDYLRARFADDPLPLRLTFADGSSFDFSPAPNVAIALRSPGLRKALLRGDFARLGDAYVAGDIVVDGRIEDILKVGISLAQRLGRMPALNWLARIGKVLAARPHTRRSDQADVRYHYDVGNEFYRLWLDELMVYSCAYFRTGAEDIHAAQRQKLDHICRKLMLRPGDRLLDIGCGWGGLLCWAAKHYGVTGTGITLSEQQYAHATQHAARLGLADRVEIRMQDYRDFSAREAFDKIVSVGMYEHVGIRNLPIYFQGVAGLLRPGGALLNHGIVTTDPAGRPRGPAGGEFIDRYVFPGGAVPHLSRVLIEVSRAGLEFADAEDLRPHYALTLQHWTRRLEAVRDEAVAAAGAQRVRIWRMFLAGMAYAFDQGWLSIAQVLAFKPAPNGEVRRPWTRDYQYQLASGETRTDVPIAGKLTWIEG